MTVRASVQVVTLGLVLMIASAGAAPAETVVVVSDDAGFVRAVDDAFRAAGIRALQLAPVPALADLTSGSREVADRERAAATVTLVFTGDSATLIAYDRAVDRALVRVLPYRAPLDPRQSAEAAHMARTMLRALRVTPEIDLPPPHPQDAIAIRARTAAAQLAPPVADPEPAAARTLGLAASGGLRFGAPGATGAASGALQLIWRPGELGLAVAASVARAGTVDAPSSFTGTVSDMAGALTARLPIGLASRWQWVGELGAAVHRVRVSGTSSGASPGTSSGGPIALARFDPALRIGTAVTFAAAAPVSVGLAGWLDALLVRQEYSVANQRVIDVPVAQLTIGVILIARIL